MMFGMAEVMKMRKIPQTMILIFIIVFISLMSNKDFNKKSWLDN